VWVWCRSTALVQDGTAPHPQAAKRAPASWPNGRSGRQLVGNYVGQRAGEAAQAVRCAGLKPGLDRLFDCEPELVGLVVSQDPAPESEAARNALITLYVGATGTAPETADPRAEGRTVHESATPQQAAVGASVVSRRRRKPGRAVRVDGGVSRDPAPAPGVMVGATQHVASDERAGRTCADPAGFAAESERPGEGVDVPQEFVLLADEVFSRGEGLRGHRSHRGLPERVREHRWLVRVAVGVLALWLAVAIASALSGPGSHRASSSSTPAAQVTAQVRRPTARARTTRARSSRVARRGPVAHRSHALRRTRAARAPVASTAPRIAPVDSSGPVAPAQPANGGGGLFSP
jgi:hypothetical protein